MKRLYYLFIALAFFGFTALSSCGGTQKPAEEVTEEVVEEAEEVIEEVEEEVEEAVEEAEEGME